VDERDHARHVHHQPARHVPRVTQRVRALLARQGKIVERRHARADAVVRLVDFENLVEEQTSWTVGAIRDERRIDGHRPVRCTKEPNMRKILGALLLLVACAPKPPERAAVPAPPPATGKKKAPPELMRRALLLLCLVACSKSEEGTKPSSGPISRSTTVFVNLSGPDAAPSSSASPPASSQPFTFDTGRFRATPPSGATQHATVSGVVWEAGGATYSILFYDGKPRGIDRSPLYVAARDHLGESAIDHEEDVMLDGRKSRQRTLHATSSKGATVYRRNVIVLAGERTFDVSVVSPERTRVEGAEAEAFFQSFHVVED
jgi:hypothetical protein